MMGQASGGTSEDKEDEFQRAWGMLDRENKGYLEANGKQQRDGPGRRAPTGATGSGAFAAAGAQTRRTGQLGWEARQVIPNVPIHEFSSWIWETRRVLETCWEVAAVVRTMSTLTGGEVTEEDMRLMALEVLPQ